MKLLELNKLIIELRLVSLGCVGVFLWLTIKTVEAGLSGQLNDLTLAAILTPLMGGFKFAFDFARSKPKGQNQNVD